MDYRVGEYLTSSFSTDSSEDSAKASKSTKALCIIETRTSFWLPRVIRNAVATFPGWPVVVLAPVHVLRWVVHQCPEAPIRPVVLDAMIHSREMFNETMFSKQFWSMLGEEGMGFEYVLMFQCDTAFAPGAKDHPVFQNPRYAMYGAVCGPLDPDRFVINGGLSFRSVKAFRDACDVVVRGTKDYGTKEDEDVVFTRHFRSLGHTPPMDVCLSFAIESVGNPSMAIGLHGTDKGFCPPPLVVSTLGIRPPVRVIDCIMYDGEPILRHRLHLLERVIDMCVVVESSVTHAGDPKDLQFPKHFPNGHPKVTYVTVDEYPPVPENFGDNMPWVQPSSKEAWWREMYQRDYAAQFVPTDEPGLVMVTDVDELPNPDAINTLYHHCWEDLQDSPIHMHMASLVYAPQWHRPRDTWTRPYVCSAQHMPTSFTHQRIAYGAEAIPQSGWHCSSFFDVDGVIRKAQHFAHREFRDQIDPDVIRTRLENGRDPYGREGMDAQHTDRYMFLSYM